MRPKLLGLALSLAALILLGDAFIPPSPPSLSTLLGHVLAAAAHTDYVELVPQRLLTPVGMAATALPLTARNLPSDAPTGYSADGVAEAPWAINGWAPAGGARSTPEACLA